MKTFIGLAMLVFSVSVSAQTRYLKISQDNLRSFDIGEAPTLCTGDRNTVVETSQRITLNLKDGSSIETKVTGEHRSTYDSNDNTIYANCAKAIANTIYSSERQALAYFSIMVGDISVEMEEGAIACFKSTINLMLNGNQTVRAEVVKQLVRCP